MRRISIEQKTFPWGPGWRAEEINPHAYSHPTGPFPPRARIGKGWFSSTLKCHQNESLTFLIGYAGGFLEQIKTIKHKNTNFFFSAQSLIIAQSQFTVCQTYILMRVCEKFLCSATQGSSGTYVWRHHSHSELLIEDEESVSESSTGARLAEWIKITLYGINLNNRLA